MTFDDEVTNPGAGEGAGESAGESGQVGGGSEAPAPQEGQEAAPSEEASV